MVGLLYYVVLIMILVYFTSNYVTFSNEKTMFYRPVISLSVEEL